MAITIYRPTDKIKINIGGVDVFVSPFTKEQRKTVTAAAMKIGSGDIETDEMEAAFLAIKYCVKDVKGLELPDGSEYELEFEENGDLKDECINDLLNIEIGAPLIQACASFANGFNREQLNSIEGVSFNPPKSRVKKKK